mgnify:CR=1 FL=1
MALVGPSIVKEWKLRKLDSGERKKMNKRQRKKQALSKLSKEARYNRTHCPVCKDKIGVFDKYFNTYGFCSEYCGYEYYGISRL